MPGATFQSSYKNTDTKRRNKTKKKKKNNKNIPRVKNKTFLFLNFIHFRKVMDETEREKGMHTYTHTQIYETPTLALYFGGGESLLSSSSS